MRTIRWSTRFDKDYKRHEHGKYRSALINELPTMLKLLASDTPLPAAARDHALTGDKKPYRDCHIKPDLVLFYHKPDDDELLLVRLGTHSELDI